MYKNKYKTYKAIHDKFKTIISDDVDEHKKIKTITGFFNSKFSIGLLFFFSFNFAVFIVHLHVKKIFFF